MSERPDWERKTIAEHMADVLREQGCDEVWCRDVGLLDMCAERCTHTTLMDAYIPDRHKRIFDALEKSPLFRKEIIWLPGRGMGNVRAFHLVEVKPGSDKDE